MARAKDAAKQEPDKGKEPDKAAEPVTQQAPARPAPLSRGRTILAVAIVTVLAAAAGALGGAKGVSAVKAALAPKADDAVASRYAGSTNVRELAPIITNLARPQETWIRLEAALVFNDRPAPIPDALASEISGDILAYLRTVTLSQIEGASGLRQLREDLNERVAIRSEGRVRELIIQTLVVQ